MDSRNGKQQMMSISIGRLAGHPDNPNRMSQVSFNKLVRHLERTGQYEPIVVRRHPRRVGAYQILNGHHRVRALKRLGYAEADCVVFEADETQALIYLATLNPLKGRSNLQNKRRLIGRLCRHCEMGTLAKLLPDTRSAIEKLKALANRQAPAKAAARKPFLTPLTFFVTDEQQRLIAEAFEKATGDETGTRTEKRLRALCRITRSYLCNDGTSISTTENTE